MISALKAKLNTRSYRAKSVTVSSGVETTMEGDYVAPDRFHIVSEYNGGGKTERVVIGRDWYEKQANGSWRRNDQLLMARIPGELKLELSYYPDDKLVDALSRSRDEDVEFAGIEELNGSQVFVYQSFWGSTQKGDRGRLRVSVGVGDGLPHQEELEFWLEGQSVRATTTFYDYNAHISIRAPQVRSSKAAAKRSR